MSRAFVSEDHAEPEPRWVLPPRDDPGYDEAAASVLLDGADIGNSYSAEQATGYRWGDAALRPHVERLLARAEAEGDDRRATLARRFLKAKP